MGKIGTIFIALLLSAGFMAEAAPVCTHTMTFFDLGQTLVNTATNNYDPMFLMPGAFEYLKELRNKGYRIGLISDVPLAWGRDNPEVSAIADPLTAKWVRTLFFLQGRYPSDKTSWKGPALDPSLFGEFVGQWPNLRFVGRVLLPMIEAEQKKVGSPMMFIKARQMAAAAGCPGVIFFGEDLKEIALARQAGMKAYWVGHDGPSFYLPVDRIDTYGTYGR